MNAIEQSERIAEYFGLRFDPFGPLADSLDFFEGAERAELVTSLAHLLEFSAQDGILVGQDGAGKSTISLELVKQLGSSWNVVYLDGQALEDPSSIISQIITDLHLDIPSREIDNFSKLKAIASEVASENFEGRRSILIVDHSDLLSADAVDILLQLRQFSPNEDERIRQLWLAQNDASAKEYWSEASVFYKSIPALTAVEAKQYFTLRLEQAGYDGLLPISDNEVDRLNEMARGLPARLNQVAGDFLMSATFRQKTNKRPFPIAHVAAGFVAFAFVVVAVLYQASGSSSEQVSVELPAELPLSAVEQRLANAVAQVEARQDIEQADDVTVLGNNEQEAGIIESVDLPPVSPETQATNQPAENSIADEELPPVKSDNIDNVVAASNEATSMDSNPSIITASDRFDNFIDSAPAEDYSLQLIGVSDQSRLSSMVPTFQDTDRVAIVETIRDGKPWFILLYGQFPSKAAALDAVSELPEPFSKQQPWARTFQSIQESR